MTLEDAIKEFQKELAIWSPIAHPIWRDAVKLGLEALKLVNAMGECPYCHVGFTLPGQTKE